MATGWSLKLCSALVAVAMAGSPGLARADEPAGATPTATHPLPGWEDEAPIEPLPPPPRAAVEDIAPEQAVRTLLREHRVLAPKYRAARGMVIGGAVGLGATPIVLLIAGGVAWSADGLGYDEEPTAAQLREDERTRRRAIGIALGGAALFVVSIGLLSAGLVRRSEVVDEARRRVRVRAGARGLALRF